MSSRRSLHLSFAFTILLLGGLMACDGDEGPTGPVDPPGFTNADGVNGGQLFDEFWEDETGWDQNDPNIATFNTYSNFFRCKQCHAWDLLGRAGSYIGREPRTTRPNVSSVNLKSHVADHTPQELFDEIKSSTNRRALSYDLSTYDPVTNATEGDKMPDFGSFMSDEDIWDLVKFLKQEAIDTDLLYDFTTSGTYPNGSITYMNIGKDGDATNGDAIYAARCVACHGADGTQIIVDGEFSAGSFLRAKPYELQHKVKFGQLGTAMATSQPLVSSVSEMKDLYVALTNATNYPDPVPPGFTAADGINGGQLFDEFWLAETGWDQNDPNIATFNTYSNFFRCKQCHAWDLLGNAGSYISRAPSTTRPNVSSVNLKSHVADHTPQELFDEIKRSTNRRALSYDLSTYDPATNATEGDKMPDFSSFMSDEAIWDLVKFLKEEAVDIDLLYDFTTTGTYPTGSISYMNIGKDGDAANGDQIYQARCVACHGNDGRQILVDGTFSVGSFLRAKPYELQHKVKFGQLGTAMATGSPLVSDITELKEMYRALTNAANYPDP